MHDRRRVADVLRQAGLGNAVEIRVELIELLLAERIELVVVAARAPHRQPEPYGPRRRDAIDDGFHEVFVLGRTTLRRHAGIAVEAAGDLLLQRRVRQHVARELLDREPIEGQVPIEGVDDPVAPGPHLLPLIEVQPVRVREARRRQPMHGHPLAVAGRRQQPVDHLLVRPRGLVGEECVDLGRGWRQARQIERHPADQRGAVGLRRGPQPFTLQSIQDERVDRIPGPGSISCCRQVRPDGSNERPQRFILRALLDPPLDQCHFAIAERLLARRHPLLGVRRRDAAQHGAAVRGTGRDDLQRAVRRHGSGRILRRRFVPVQAQVRLSRARIRTMTPIALLEEDRSDVTIEPDRLRDGFSGCNPGEATPGRTQRGRHQGAQPSDAPDGSLRGKDGTHIGTPHSTARQRAGAASGSGGRGSSSAAAS